ncbi:MULTISPECIES: class I tRNA ligase family protein [unclassified Hydrogenobaculum]|jgi:leucyl-tRNA synthetase|uniref:class I tRNA ligase family protein n=1 Tax=unclassified Hydrogenobaculum TaxID=2622382 RepID=UPI0001C50723|nr:MULTISPECIES: class I tRNA ligase family protein [unclassified Hydrogenobaculum]AEF19200.1 Leucine--tRNA ligase [Hydrogenobaculum sp. 3684]AEG46489.1 Leucine--tRNA ligase [Hydrogenobaculum sp. SHO]AGG15133.1 aminoacyl-tRNA synthetase class Ia [Hydrogenobaculum sp. HO]AGH93431.1 leucyl-tRNA synthetase [Hydrogenobaculum sp. SN]
MKIKDFLKENKLSIGDNVRFLLEKLGKESLENTIESKLGEAAKMSKSKANTIDPAIAIEKYGADTIRLYILFAAPPEQDFEWIETSIEGVHRFLKRVFNFVTSNISILKAEYDTKEKNKDLYYEINKCIQRYRKDLEKYQFNTMIASAMELFNYLQDFKPSTDEDKYTLKEGVLTLLKMLYPMAPHITSELFEMIGYDEEIKLPALDESALVKEKIDIPVQINGKLRSTITIPAGADESLALQTALQDDKIKKYLDGKEIRKVIFVRDKLLNIVI